MDSRTLGKSVVSNLTSERQEVQIYPLEKPDHIPNTISKSYLKIKTLKLEYKFNEAYTAAVDSISNVFSGWRKVRGDGNCYYRSVITAYILKILHPYKNNIELEKFVSILNRLKTTGRFSNSIGKMYNFFKPILDTRKGPDMKVKIFEKVNKSLQEKPFDTDLIYTARSIALDTLNLPDDNIIKVFIQDEIDFVTNHVSSYGTEAEGIELKMLPVGLDIKVVQYNNNLNGNFLVSEFFNDSVSKPYLKVNIICKAQGHYDILYSVEDMENEEFNFYSGCYSFLRYKML